MGSGGVARTARWLGGYAAHGALAVRPVRFLVVGGTCFVSVVLIFEALRRALPLPVAATLAYAVGATASYELNRSWTFGRTERTWPQAARFLTITGAAMAANALLLQAIVATYGVPEVAAEVVALACLAPLTFLAYRFWGFRAADDEGLRLGPGGAVMSSAGAEAAE
jgi:putative flippase GtrA